MRDLGIRHILLFLIAVGLAILVGILIVRSITGGNDNNAEQEPSTALVNYADTGVVMRMTVEGPIVADQDFRSIVVRVGASQNQLQTLTGYQGSVDVSQSFASNSTAYANFLRALDIQGFTEGNDDEALADFRGYCPGGKRYIFDIVDGQEITQRYWTTSCGRSIGNFRGNASQVANLFRAQIPGYNDLVRDTGIN